MTLTCGECECVLPVYAQQSVMWQITVRPTPAPCPLCVWPGTGTCTGVCVHVWVSVVFLPLQSKRALAHSLALSELSAPTQMFYVLWPQTEAQCCVSQRSWECGGFERERLCVCERENATVRERAQSHTVCECIKYYCKIVCVCEPSEWGENMDLYVCESTKPTKLVLLNLYFVCFLVKICFIPYLLEKQN